MVMDETTRKAELFDQFLDNLSRNPNVIPPRDLEPEIATLGRKLALVENDLAAQVAQNQSMQSYIWQRALAGAEAEWQVSQPPVPIYAPLRRNRRKWLFPLITLLMLTLGALLFLLLHEPETRISVAKPAPLRPTEVPKFAPTLLPTVVPPPTPSPNVGVVPVPPDTKPGTYTNFPSSTEVPKMQLPPSARKLEDFKIKLTRDFTPEMAEKVFGKPDQITGSGLIIYIYWLPDGSQVWLGFPGYDKISYAKLRAADGTELGDLLPGK